MSAIAIKKIMLDPEDFLTNQVMQSLADDSFATEGDILAHKIAMDEYHRGETVSDEDMDWD
ncbi:MAG: hypothetical protein FWB71_05840 [Defluviitaleaceae bacterium]|nr:hypothetical protein [Defluviitaleaceae bacterium]